MPRLLVVDDEPGVRESLRMMFRDDWHVDTTESVAAALELLDAGPSPDVILLDLVMPGGSGLSLLRALGERDEPAPSVVVLTATRSVESAVEAMQLGAVDYVTKPFDVSELRIKVGRLLEQRALVREVEELRAQVESRDGLGELVGRGDAMQRLFETLRRVAPTQATVLIRGESGTGKELVARALHQRSERSEGPMVAVNCAAIPENLIESELFGHERGAFTGATERHIGKFELASGGTLFLDEIGELQAPVQAKLLRALQERCVERVGGAASLPVDVRVVAATNRDLESDVASGRFRQDLFFRINVVEVAVPPLRERREDIAALAQHFLERARAEHGGGPATISAEARSALERYAWPGNVRELENAVVRAVALSGPGGDASSASIGLDDLPPSVVREAHVEHLRADLRSGRIGFAEAVANLERELLLEALERHQWNQTRAADQLRMTRRALKLKMDKLGLKSQG